MKLAILIVSVLTVLLSGCASVQETYKPLYQTTPEIHQIEVE